MFIPIIKQIYGHGNLENYYVKTFGKEMYKILPFTGTGLATLPLPSFAGVEELCDRLDAECIDRLREQEKVTLEKWNRLIPLSDGESLENAKIVATLEAWLGLPPGLLCYIRETNLSVAFFVMTNSAVDLDNGQLKAPNFWEIAIRRIGRLADGNADFKWNLEAGCIPPYPSGTVHPGNRATTFLQDSTKQVISSIFEIALSVLGVAAFGLGPRGIIIAAGATGIEGIFSQYFAPTKGLDIETLNTTMTNLLEQNAIANQANAVSSSLSAAQARILEMSDMDSNEEAALARVASNTLLGNSPLQEALTFFGGDDVKDLMKTSDLQKQTISLYALAASTKILWCKIAIFTDDSKEIHGDPRLSSYNSDLIETCKTASSYLTTEMNTIRKNTLKARLAEISEAIPYPATAFGRSPIYGYAFTDGDQVQSFIPDSGCCQQNSHKGAVEVARTEYYNDVTATTNSSLDDEFVDTVKAITRLNDNEAKYTASYKTT
jgi:hypothetical protein